MEAKKELEDVWNSLINEFYQKGQDNVEEAKTEEA